MRRRAGVEPQRPAAIKPSERELRLERALRLARMAIKKEETAAHDLLAVIDSALHNAG